MKLISMSGNKWENRKPFGSECFYIKKRKVDKNTYPLDYYLNQFNTDDYWCFKSTNKQRLLTLEEIKIGKYASYIFFKKDVYKLEPILEWLDYVDKYCGGHQFLNKPVPPFSPKQIILR